VRARQVRQVDEHEHILQTVRENLFKIGLSVRQERESVADQSTHFRARGLFATIDHARQVLVHLMGQEVVSTTSSTYYMYIYSLTQLLITATHLFNVLQHARHGVFEGGEVAQLEWRIGIDILRGQFAGEGVEGHAIS
jgi:hypothetical protein